MENATQSENQSPNEPVANGEQAKSEPVQPVQDAEARTEDKNSAEVAQDTKAEQEQSKEDKESGSVANGEQAKSEPVQPVQDAEARTEDKESAEIVKKTKPEQSKEDRDSDYTDVDEEEDLKLKIPEESSTENTNLEENVKKLNLNEGENEKNQALEPTKKGKYFQHDTREESADNGQAKNEKWNHDKFEGKEKREKRANNRKRPNKNLPKNRPNNQDNNKGVSFDEYMKQNEPEKAEAKLEQKPNQSRPREIRRDDVKPTPVNELKSRLDFRTRVPTVLDEMEHDNNNQQRGHNQYHRGPNRTHGNNSERKFDKPFEKNEKLDILITTNFNNSTRQVSLSSQNNRPRYNERRAAQNRQDNFTHYAAQSGNNQRRGYNQSYEDNSHSFSEYMGYGEFGNGNENQDFSHIRTQTFNNRNFSTYDQGHPRQNQRPLTRGNHH